MRKHLLITLFLCLLPFAAALAQKQLYIPSQMKSEGYSETATDKMWSKLRSRESDNFVVYWQSGYGENDPNSSAVPAAYRVDIDDLLKKLESFYDLYINKLKFAEVGVGKSNLDKYKMIICLYYTTEWMAYGSGFDDVIGGMWINPSTCKPVGSTIAHELGHAFQYQCFCDLKGYAGFRYGTGQGSTYWEQTAQWQSYQTYPMEAFTSYNFSVYMDNHHRAFTNEWQRYASYFFHYYQAEKHGIDIIGRIWRGGIEDGEDANEVYMRLLGLTAEDFYKECFDAAMKFATWDIDALRDNGKNYIGRHTYNYIDLGNRKFQVAYSSTPQATGYNLIPLQVPEAGTEIQTVFTALRLPKLLAEGDPGICNKKDDGSYETTASYNYNSKGGKRGFRHGYVALLSNGERVYHYEDSIYGRTQLRQDENDTTTFVVPENTEKLWFVVSPAPEKYIRHLWNENEKDDDQHPYQVQFEGTDIVGHVDIGDPDVAPQDTTIHYYIGVPINSTQYTGTTVDLSVGDQANALAQALKIQPKNIGNYMTAYAATQADNTIMLLPLNPKTLEVVERGSTAQGYGHWFLSDGNVGAWGDATATVFAEYNTVIAAIVVGQYPGRLKNRQEVTIGQAFRYKKDGKTVTAKLVFHVFGGQVPTAIESVEAAPVEKVNVYDITGRLIRRNVDASTATENLRKGIYIVGGKKVLVR